MNFKTTLVLLILLVVGGAAVFFTKDRPADTPDTETPTGKKLLTINGGDVQTLTITPAGGTKRVLQRDGLGWNFTAPLNAPADAGVINAMVADLVAMESQSSVPVSDGSGLKSPRFVVDLATTDGKTTTVSIGERSGVGDRLYVQLKGNDKADLVSAGVDEQLDKPLDELRDKKLVALTSDQIKYIALDRPEGKLELVKDGGAWKITSPLDVAADDGAVSDLLFTVTGLRAVEFVEGSAATPTFGLGDDARKVTISTAAPSTTQPTTTPAVAPPTSVTIAFGRPDSVLQQNVFANVSGSDAVVKVAKASTSFLDRKPLELRDKQVADIDPAAVNIVSVVINTPATTQPTTRPAETRHYVVHRRPPPATQPATTQASTRPAPSTWVTTAGEPANDDAVAAILSALHPLKGERFIESAPGAGKTVSIKLETGGGGVRVIGQTELKFIAPETGQPVGTYNGLNFEVERSLLDKLETDFTKPGPAPAAGPEAPPMGPMMP